MIGQILDNRYRITSIFSSGIFGQTYLAEDISTSMPLQCIVRQLRLHSKGSEAMKFIQGMLKTKLEALKEVNSHDQIPAILAHFDDGESFYLVEEYISGHPLSEELEPHKPLAEKQVIQIMQEVLEVLAFMHDHRITHLCIQPTTLIRRHADEKLVLTGSGVMREISSQLLKSPSQQHQAVLMHPSTIYTPIEQIKGNPQLNSDLYALGMVAIQALSGLPVNVLSRVKNQNGSSDSEFVWQEKVEASPELVKILEHMVHRDSHRRYQTARDVLNDLNTLSEEQALNVAKVKSEEPLNAATLTDPELEQLPDLVVDDRSLESARSPKRFRLYMLVGAAMLMLICGTLVALVGGHLPGAFSSSGDGANKATNSAKNDKSKNDKSGTSDRKAASSESEALFQEGQKSLANGKPQDAMANLTRSIQLDPENAKAFYTRGNIRMTLGDRQNAFKDYNEAIRLDPNLTSAYVNRGSVRADLGDDQGAITDYSRAIELDNTIGAAFLNRCLSRSNVGDQKGAIDDCTQAISLQPDNVFAYQNRGLARRRLGEPQTAIQDFNIAMKLDPEDADSYYNRGLARRELGDYQGAVADYTVAIKLHPGHALARYDRALAKVELGDPDGAISDFQQSAKFCLDAGRITCYNDAQYQIKQLQSQQL